MEQLLVQQGLQPFAASDASVERPLPSESGRLHDVAEKIRKQQLP